MLAISIFNTLSGKMEALKPLRDGEVSLYACGVTTYDDCHIGHAMQAIFFDVIRNFLQYAGYRVIYVRNFTDVDDKVIARAGTLGISPDELSAKLVAASREDMAALQIKPATHEPRVSENIPQIIEMVTNLIEKGFAYATQDGDVYFRVRNKNDYGKLSNRKPDELKSGTRDIIAGDKEDELDFALWKRDDTKGASWPSPWGPGRPGWHIECSAMARRYLGETIDIHGGGRDLVFPHHENEIAQSEAASGKPFSSYWAHSGLLTINHQKMSKSLGNHIPIKVFLKSWPAEVLRLAFLRTHYRSNIDFSTAVFAECRRRLLYYYESLLSLDELVASEESISAETLENFDPSGILRDFEKEMADDFNTCNAVAVLNGAFRKANELLSTKKSPRQIKSAQGYILALRKAGEVLGLLQANPGEFIDTLKDQVLPELGLTRDAIAQMITQRSEARAAKNFAESDRIRSELEQKGILLKDQRQGTAWSIQFRE